MKDVPVKQFVKRLEVHLGPQVFARVCDMAAAKEMGFGTAPTQWGHKDGRA